MMEVEHLGMRRRWRSGQGVTFAAARATIRALPASKQIKVKTRLGMAQPWEDGVVLPPPPCPEGQVTGPPDFVGVGAQRSGTSWWFGTLQAQSGIYNHSGIDKERHFFNRYFLQDFGMADCDEYHRWFPRPPGCLAGEFTPDYMYHFWIPALLAQAAPAAKLLVMLRDPVERYRSGLTFNYRHRDVLRTAWATEAFERGLYAEQLRYLERYYPRDQILVLQFEQCEMDPACQLRRTLEFLGLRTNQIVGPVATRLNATVRNKVHLPDSVRAELIGRYRQDLNELFTAYPDLDPSLWPTARAVI